MIWAMVLAAASAIVLLANAAEKISKTISAARAPNTRQDERISALEEWKKTHAEEAKELAAALIVPKDEQAD